MKAAFIAPTFIGSAFAAAVSVRDPNGPCAPTSKSTAPAPLLDTLAGFYEWNGYHLLALNARAPTGYETTLANGNCSINSSRYMMYTKLQTYDVQACADLCDVHRGCDAFNIYIQREPSVSPSAICPNPKAIFITYCALYSEPVSLSYCTNAGHYIGPKDAKGEAFRTAIRASNIYTRLPPKDAIRAVTNTLNILPNEQNLHIEASHSSETTASKESMPTATSITSVLDDISGAVKKLLLTKLITPTVSEAAGPLSTSASAIPVISSAQQPEPTTVRSPVTTLAPVTLVIAHTTEIPMTPPVPTTFSIDVLIGTPYVGQVGAPISEAAGTPTLATPVAVVIPGTPSAKAILQSKLRTLLQAAIPPTPSLNHISTPAATQSSTPTASSTASAVETHLSVRKRFSIQGHRHGIFNKP